MNKANNREYRTKLDYSIGKRVRENYLLNPFLWSFMALTGGAAFWLNREYNAFSPLQGHIDQMALLLEHYAALFVKIVQEEIFIWANWDKSSCIGLAIGSMVVFFILRNLKTDIDIEQAEYAHAAEVE